MNKWNMRSKEVANLLNPAFCSMLITSSVVGYNEINSEGLPFSLSFMVLPIILNDNIRKKLPRTRKTSLTSWLIRNTDAKLIFQENVTSMKPYSSESVLFGILHGSLKLTHSTNLKSSFEKKDINKLMKNYSKGESSDCIKRSTFLGRWFAINGTTETIMALWGVKP